MICDAVSLYCVRMKLVLLCTFRQQTAENGFPSQKPGVKVVVETGIVFSTSVTWNRTY